GARPRLVEEKDQLAAAAKQHRIPARLVLLFRGDLGFRPGLAVEARPPDLDVRRALALAAEPRRHELALVHLDDGRGVTRGERGFLEDEHGASTPAHGPGTTGRTDLSLRRRPPSGLPRGR